MYFNTQVTENAIEFMAEEDKEENEESLPLYSDLSQEKEIWALAMAVTIYERRRNVRNVEAITEALRTVQQNIWWELAKEKEERLQQHTINQYFKQ